MWGEVLVLYNSSLLDGGRSECELVIDYQKGQNMPPVFFTGRSGSDIVIENYEVKLKKKMKHT